MNAEVKITNLTPHSVAVFEWKEDPIIVLPPQRTAARLGEDISEVGNLEVEGVNLRLRRARFNGSYDGLPEPSPGEAYLVSRLTAEALPQRRDLYFPLTERRDGSGRILGCETLAQVWSDE